MHRGSALLGFLLGIGILKSFVKDDKANAKADQLIAKLAPHRGTLGLVAIGLGLWGVFRSIIHSIVMSSRPIGRHG